MWQALYDFLPIYVKGCFVNHALFLVLIALWAFCPKNIWHIRSCNPSSWASTQEEERRRGYLWYQSHRKQAQNMQSVVPQTYIQKSQTRCSTSDISGLSLPTLVFCFSSFQSICTRFKVQNSSGLLKVKTNTRKKSDLLDRRIKLNVFMHIVLWLVPQNVGIIK